MMMMAEFILEMGYPSRELSDRWKIRLGPD